MARRQDDENEILGIILVVVRFWWTIIVAIIGLVSLGYAFKNSRKDPLANKNVWSEPSSGLKWRPEPDHSIWFNPKQDIELLKSLWRFIKFIAPYLMLIMGGVCVALMFPFYIEYQQETDSFWRADYLQSMVIVGVLGIVLLTGGMVILWIRTPQDNDVITESKETEQTGLYPNYYTVRLPKKAEKNNDLALKLIDQLLTSFPQLGFVIEANDKQVEWHIVDAELMLEPSLIENTIRAAYPQAEVEVYSVAPPQEEKPPFHRYISYYQQPNIFVAPMRHVSDFKQNDPLTSLAQIMSELKPDEHITYAILIEDTAADAYKEGQRLITQSTIHPMQYLVRGGLGDALGKKATGTDRTDLFEYEHQHIFEDKLQQKLYLALVLLQVDAPSLERVVQLTVLIDTQMANFTRMPYNGLQWVQRDPSKYAIFVTRADQAHKTSVIQQYQQWKAGKTPDRRQAPRVILEPREIAALWHLPQQEFTAPRIAWSEGTITVPEAVTRLKNGITLGVGKTQGKGIKVKINPADRDTHMLITGKTRTGKSTLLHQLIHQDIQRGECVAVIDPHGTLVQNILQTSIPPKREEDVVVLDFANLKNPPPLNPLRGLNSPVRTGQVINVIESLFAGTEQQPQVAKYLNAAINTLQVDDQPTMRDIGRVFRDADYRARLIARLDEFDHAQTLDVWDDYPAARNKDVHQIYDPILSRISPFYQKPDLYSMMCHPDSLDFGAFIRERKIILISLKMDDERVSEGEIDLVGRLLVSRLQMSGMKNAQKTCCYLYIDEVQRFVTSRLDVLFSEAAKFGISLTVAHQFLGQLPQETLQAVMGNVGTSITFRCGVEDAKAFAHHLRPEFDVTDLVNLNMYSAAVKLQHEGITQPAFSLYTFPPIEKTDDALEVEQHIRALSIKNHTPMSREEVKQWLVERYKKPSPNQAAITPDEEATMYEPKPEGE